MPDAANARPDALHTTVVGAGPLPVVFLHGLFGQGKNFSAIAKALAAEATSTLVDLPNHGRSPWTETFSYVDMAEAVAAMMRQGPASDGPVDLVGHSMGGKVAMIVALRHPDLVRRLVVVDISPAGTQNHSEFRHLVDSMLDLDLAAVERRSHADAQLANTVTSPGTRGFLLQNLREGESGWAWQNNLELTGESLDSIMSWPADKIGQASFDGPVLWIAGEHSHYVTPEHLPAMRALFPRVLQVTIKDAGHWVHSEQPTAFVSALRTFLGAPDRS